MSPLLSRILLASAALAFSFPVYAFAHWVMVYDAERPREEVVQQFLAGFPYTWRSPQTIVLLSLGGCVAAILLAKLARRGLSDSGLARAATILIVLACGLGAWNLFTMM
jgi:hypothetical protein